MKKIVSVFGKPGREYNELNEKTLLYAREKGLKYEWIPINEFTNENVAEAFREADAGIIDVERYDAEIFSRIYKKTRLLIRFGVGYDAVNLKDAADYGILVARTPGANASGVAEQALTLMLAVKRRVAEHHKSMAEGKWIRKIGTETNGTTVGIVGFGAVGRTLAKYLKGLGCRILAYDPYLDSKDAEASGVERAELETLFRESDEISLHLPLNDQTKKLVNEKLISMMKQTAIIVNTSRGGVIDEEAMTAALKQGRILGAGLDVFESEPLSPDSPLRSLPNVVLSPHVSGNTMESLWGVYKCAVDIAAGYFGGNIKDWSHCLLNYDMLK